MEKMNFDQFKDEVVKKIREYLSDSFKNAEISVEKVNKTNDVRLTGLTIRRKDTSIAPTIYLESFYEKYERGYDFSSILEEIAILREKNDGSEIEEDVLELVDDYEKSKEKIVPRLLGKDRNEQLMLERPHFDFCDFAVTFAIEIGECDDGSMSIPINNTIAERWGVKAEDLYTIAVANISKPGNSVLSPIWDVLFEILERKGFEDEIVEPMDDRNAMYVLSNKNKVFGASAILDKGIMQKAVQKFGEGFYILPSSIHEVIILPASDCIAVEALEEMVREVNSTQVEPGERLSDFVYQYTTEYGIQRAS